MHLDRKQLLKAIWLGAIIAMFCALADCPNAIIEAQNGAAVPSMIGGYIISLATYQLISLMLPEPNVAKPITRLSLLLLFGGLVLAMAALGFATMYHRFNALRLAADIVSMPLILALRRRLPATDLICTPQPAASPNAAETTASPWAT